MGAEADGTGIAMRAKARLRLLLFPMKKSVNNRSDANKGTTRV